MAKKPSAIYEPGELDKLRKKLGDIDKDEAKRMASLLGGEVGVEKATATAPRESASRDGSVYNQTVSVSVQNQKQGAFSATGIPKRRVEVLDQPIDSKKSGKKKTKTAGIDDPKIQPKTTYRERIRIDRYLALPEFEVKNSSQVLMSLFSLFKSPPDYVNYAFVSTRMNDYYERLETLVTTTRALCPRNNLVRSELFRQNAPFSFSILDTIRTWDIERITGDLARLQANPRNIVISDFTEILKAFYRPIYILENLSPESHVRDAFHLLYKQIQKEVGVPISKEKYSAQFRAALAAYEYVTRKIRYLLYPMLLKLHSDRWLSYEEFFSARKKRLEAFLEVSPAEKLVPPPEPEKAADEKPAEASPEEAAADAEAALAAEQQKKNQQMAQSRAWLRSIEVLEELFPKAGWSQLSSYPDLYPYFADVFELKKGFELVSPHDPLQQAVILMHILEELFYGMRFIEFGIVTGKNNENEHAGQAIGSIIENWHGHLEESLGKHYLPLLSEYCRLLDSSSESRFSNYAKKTLTEIFWFKRLHFLPYLQFDSSFSPHAYRKADDKPFYIELRELKRLLTIIAAGIEDGIKRGGAAADAKCVGIVNPWDACVFQIPNPVSRRFEALFSGRQSRKRNNASLVFFTLAATTVLDGIVNDKNGYAYQSDAGCPFRTVDSDTNRPLFGVDDRINAEELFRQSLKERQEKQE